MWIVVYLITWLVGFQCTELNTDLPRLTGAALPIRLATIYLITWLEGFQCTELNTDLPRLNGAANSY